MTTVAISTAGVFVLQDQDADFSAFVTRLLALTGYASAGYAQDFSQVFVHFEDTVDQSTADAAVQTIVADHMAGGLLAVMQERMVEVNNYRDLWGSSHFSYDGHRWDCDVKGVRNIEKVNQTALILANANQDLPAGFVFRSKDNINVPANAAYMAGMDAALFAFGNNCYLASWIHKYMISQCATIQAVRDYDIEAGWPARE